MSLKPRRVRGPSQLTRTVRLAAQKYGPEALRTLAKWMRQEENMLASIAAAKELLDRAYGRSVQPVDQNIHVTHEEAVDEVSRRLEEYDRQQELKRQRQANGASKAAVH